MTTSSQPSLTVTGGPLNGTVLDFGGRRLLLLGTGTECHLRVEAGHIEAVHAKVAWNGTELLLSDSGSVAGTYVNGVKVGAEHALQDGDRVCLGPPGFKGSVKLVVSLPAEAIGAPLPEVEDDFDLAPAAPAPLPPMPLEDDGFTLSEPAAPAPPPAFEFDEAHLAPPAFEDAPAAASPHDISPSVFPPVPPPEPEFEEGGLAVEDEPEPPPPPRPMAPLLEIPPLAPPPAAPPPPPPPPPPRAAPAPPPPAAAKQAESPKTGALRKAEYTDGFQLDLGTSSSGGMAAPPPAVSSPPKPAKAAPPPPAPRSGGITPMHVIKGLVAAALLFVAWVGFRLAFPYKPEVIALSPQKLQPGQKVTLSGKHFGAVPEKNAVKFGATAGQVVAASTTELTVTVPDLPVKGVTEVPVVVETKGGPSQPVTLKVFKPPKVTALEPPVAMPGDEVALVGQNLEGGTAAVKVGPAPAQVKEAKDGRIVVVVPALEALEGAEVPVNLQVGGEAAAAVNLVIGHLPLVTKVEPASVQPGDRLTLRGLGFDPEPRATTVTLGGVPALVISATKDAATVAVPDLGVRGQQAVPVVVTAGGASSSGRSTAQFNVPGGALYAPRFHAAAVPEHPDHDHAFVAFEGGPVLLLTGKAAAGSTGERAAGVADALNKAFAATPATFEVRGTDAPAVALAGAPEVLVQATPEDAAGYAEGWVGGKPTTPTPASLAAFWAALLQDHHTLFVAHERPTRALDLTARAKALLDLHADATRRGGPGAAVPAALISPPAPPLAKALRDLALGAPEPKGGGSSAIAVAGDWDGTLEETGVGSKAFQLTLKLEGSRLGGSFATKVGGVTMNTQLSEVAYDKGVLSFVLRLGGAPRRFKGTLQGGAVEGVVAAADKGAEVGRFSMKFVQ